MGISTLEGTLKTCNRGKNPATILEMVVESREGFESKVQIVVPGLFGSKTETLERLAKTPAVKVKIGAIDDGTGKISWRDTRAPGLDMAAVYCHHMAVDNPPDISAEYFTAAVKRFAGQV